MKNVRVKLILSSLIIVAVLFFSFNSLALVKEEVKDCSVPDETIICVVVKNGPYTKTYKGHAKLPIVQE